jgi:Flp pilus assembly pilin Flp
MMDPVQMQVTPRSDVIQDTRGVTYVEYTILLCLVTVVGAVALSALGYPLIQTYRYAQLVLGAPIP